MSGQPIDTSTRTIQVIARNVDNWFQGQPEWGETLERLAAERDALAAQIADAREACPVVRRQDYFDAPLLTIVEKTVSILFAAEARYIKAEAALAALQQERDEFWRLANARHDRAELAEEKLSALEAEHEQLKDLLESEGNAKRHYERERDDLKEQLGLYRRSMEMLCKELDRVMSPDQP